MISLSFALRTELRQEPFLEAPGPAIPVRGVEGLSVADNMLKKLEVVGILIGGVAKSIWAGCAVRGLSARKDVDVLVMSTRCAQHPKQHEGGIDWWVSHALDARPTNGNGVGLLYWRAATLNGYPPGLWLAPLTMLQECEALERRVLRSKPKARWGWDRQERPQLALLKTFPSPALLEGYRGRLSHPIDDPPCFNHDIDE